MSLCHLRSGGGAASAPSDSEEVPANSVTTPTTTGNGVDSQETSQTPVSSSIQFFNDKCVLFFYNERNIININLILNISYWGYICIYICNTILLFYMYVYFCFPVWLPVG